MKSGPKRQPGKENLKNRINLKIKVTKIKDTSSIDKDKSLLSAAKNGNGKRVDQLIAKGAKVDTTDSTGKTPLHFAVISLDGLNITKALLDKNANIEVLFDGMTLLHFLCLYGKYNVPAISRLLILRGANKETLYKQMTPLHHAIAKNRTAMVKSLLRSGVDIDALYKDMTPLHHAISRKNIEMIKILVNGGSDTQARYKDMTPLHHAVYLGSPKMVTSIIANNVVEESLYQNMTPVQHAISIGKATIVRTLHKLGADKDALYKGMSLSHFAIEKGQTTIAQMLINAGAKLETLYKECLRSLFTTKFSEFSSEKDLHTDSTPNRSQIKVIHNNYGYLEESVLSGQPLYLDDLKSIPIGYNIHFPASNTKIKNVIVHVYGGSSKFYPYFYRPGQINLTHQHLLSEGCICITLNLPDLLKLDKYQHEMPSELFEEIHACIHKFYQTLKNSPQDLHIALKAINFSELKLFLYGASFGGMMVIRHAQLYPHTFDGYISHDGALSNTMADKSDLLVRPPFGTWLDAAHIQEVNKISDRLLLLHNKDDHNVSVKETLHFYQLLEEQGKADLARVCIIESGNSIPGKEIHNKGHYIPTDPAVHLRYVSTIRDFMRGSSITPTVTVWQAYIQDKLSNSFYRSATPKEEILALMLESQRLNSNMPASMWEKQYQPLYYALNYAYELSMDAVKLNMEKSRLLQNALLSEEVIINTIRGQSFIFSQYVKEMHNIILPNNYFSNIKIEMISVFREAILQVLSYTQCQLTTKEQFYVRNMLGALYKSNPSIIEPLYPQFEKGIPANDAFNIKEEFRSTCLEETKLITNVWQQVVRKMIDRNREKNKNSADLNVKIGFKTVIC